LDQALRLSAIAGNDAELRLSALLGAGRLALWQVDLGGALRYVEQGRVLARQLDHRRGLAEALALVGTTYRRQGDFDRAEKVLQRSLALHDSLDDEAGVAFAQFNLAVIVVNRCDIKQCDWSQAAPLCEAVLARYRTLA